MKRYISEISRIITMLFILALPAGAAAGVFHDFDDLPVTAKSDVPGSGGGWLYTSHITNFDDSYPMSKVPVAGWRNTVPYNTSVYDYFFIYKSTYNSSHMGFETFGYLEISNDVTVSGNSLRFAVTGGKNSVTCDGETGASCTGAKGLPLTTKEKYMEYHKNSQNPIEGGMTVGSPYIYFMNSSSTNNLIPFDVSQGTTRLSLYVKAPATQINGEGGNGNPPQQTIVIGPYSYIGKDIMFPGGDAEEIIKGHWYHQCYTQGGGWTHIIVDSHPQHNNSFSNASLYPYPSNSIRNIGSVYFNNMFRFYVSLHPYEGIGVPPYAVYLDEIEFISDSEPQNNETINSPSVTFSPQTKIFEIGFNDKYKNNQYSYSTYEVRYSFSPITNANWESATPVYIMDDSRFGISASTDGKFKKWWPYFQAVWAPFKLASTSDEEKLIIGTTVYFAIKDISQIDGDSQVPIANNAGRRYADFPDLFDYEGDKPALKYIKRIDYKIGKIDIPSSPTSLILPNSNN